MAAGVVDWTAFLHELLRGKALTKQLDTQLDGQFSADCCRSTVHGILASWERLVYMASSIKCEYPPSPPRGKALHHVSKKRKVLPTCSRQVRVAEAAGVEGHDGHNWRKYGQKRILGARNPREYYRCTHKITQGCQALKMVQRSDEDPSLLDVTYRGDHTCSSHRASRRRCHGGILHSFKEELRVETEGLNGELPSDLPDSDQLTPATLNQETWVSATPDPSIFEAFRSIAETNADESFADEAPVTDDPALLFRWEESAPDFESLFAEGAP